MRAEVRTRSDAEEEIARLRAQLAALGSANNDFALMLAKAHDQLAAATEALEALEGLDLYLDFSDTESPWSDFADPSGIRAASARAAAVLAALDSREE